MSSPSPQKPKWSPGGAIRRTSTILSMGRKTPSRASSEYSESDSSSVKPSSVPPSPTPKSSSPRTSLEEDATSGSPSKSKLARMGGALRGPSSLIPSRRRTTSMASSLKDAFSINSKTAQTTRSSTDPDFAPQPALTAEPEPFIPSEADPTPSEPALPEAQPPHAEPEQTAAPLVEAAPATELTDEPEELVEEPLSLQSEGQPAPATLNTELNEQVFIEQTPLSAVEEEPPTPAALEKEGDKAISPSIVPEAMPVPIAEPISGESETVETEAVIKPITAEPAEPPSLVPESVTAGTVSADEAAVPIQNEEPSPAPEPVAHDETIQEPTPADHDLIVPEPLDTVASLNSSFEDLGASVEPTADAIENVVPVESSVVTLAGEVSSSDVKVEEDITEDASAAISSAKEEPAQAVEVVVPSVAAGEQTHPLATAVLPLVSEEPLPTRNLPLEIPAASVESAAPSPAVTQPLLSLSEVHDLSTTRQQNGSLAPPRDRHQPKVPQEYRSVLRTLLDALLGLVRWWRRGHC
ncbi:hypothetical protein H0H92_011291 [Tricholoma furcatifolium]|nr:hypothetical protein H0H92_011291 [Tricholoma furcatifolium]